MINSQKELEVKLILVPSYDHNHLKPKKNYPTFNEDGAPADIKTALDITSFDRNLKKQY